MGVREGILNDQWPSHAPLCVGRHSTFRVPQASTSYLQRRGALTLNGGSRPWLPRLPKHSNAFGAGVTMSPIQGQPSKRRRFWVRTNAPNRRVRGNLRFRQRIGVQWRTVRIGGSPYRRATTTARPHRSASLEAESEETPGKNVHCVVETEPRGTPLGMLHTVSILYACDTTLHCAVPWSPNLVYAPYTLVMSAQRP